MPVYNYVVFHCDAYCMCRPVYTQTVQTFKATSAKNTVLLFTAQIELYKFMYTLLCSTYSYIICNLHAYQQMSFSQLYIYCSCQWIHVYRSIARLPHKFVQWRHWRVFRLSPSFPSSTVDMAWSVYSCVTCSAPGGRKIHTKSMTLLLLLPQEAILEWK